MFGCRSYFWTGTKKINILRRVYRYSSSHHRHRPPLMMMMMMTILKSAIDYDFRLQRKRTTPSFQQPTTTTTLTDTTGVAYMII